MKKRMKLRLVFVSLLIGVFLIGGVSGFDYTLESNGATIIETESQGTLGGIVTNVLDGDTSSTYLQRSISAVTNGGSSRTADSTVEITFDQTASVLDNIQYWNYYGHSCDGWDMSSTNQLIIEIMQSGSWNNAATITNPITDTITGSWQNVDGIRASITSTTSCDPTWSAAYSISSTARIYSIQANGLSCTPDCSGKVCGDDGCGGSCGDCDPGYDCVEGACACSPDQTIMKLFQEENSHGAIYSDSDYNIDICYPDYFGDPYTGDIATVHDCTGDNNILNLFQSSNSHAEVDGTNNYPIEVCYGNLECQYTNEANCIANDGIIIASLFQLTNSHIAKGNFIGYDTKICCGSSFIADVYWADMSGGRIGQDVGITAEREDTVTMIWKDSGLDPGDFVTFEVFENDPVFDDPIRTISGGDAITGIVAPNGDAIGKWKISQADLDKTAGFTDFIFKVNTQTSNELEITTTPDNAVPTTTITAPDYDSNYVIQSLGGETGLIDFIQSSSDEDDDLNILWEFGDGESKSFENCLTSGNCDTTHTYNSKGTKRIKLTASEMTRNQKASEGSRVFVYGPGINVFSIIDETISGRVVTIDISRTHVADCYSLGSCPGTSCYTVTDEFGDSLECYDKNLIYPWESNPNIQLFWEFDGVEGVEDLRNGLEFIKIFNSAGEHDINLMVAYKE